VISPSSDGERLFSGKNQSTNHRASKQTIAVMCSEENPAKCHCHHLIGLYLMDQGIEVIHIRGDGNAVNGKQFSGLADESFGDQAELF
jgi:uncharacterized protein (DUF488 family)